jgi:hypothetical protein
MLVKRILPSLSYFWGRLASKFWKSAKRATKIFLYKASMGIKKHRILCYVKFAGNISKKLTTKKL